MEFHLPTIKVKYPSKDACQNCDKLYMNSENENDMSAKEELPKKLIWRIRL